MHSWNRCPTPTYGPVISVVETGRYLATLRTGDAASTRSHIPNRLTSFGMKICTWNSKRNQQAFRRCHPIYLALF
ncbi:uncharacterized protein EI90DRAFT_3053358, partial [Cantharellus anzutake]|uniref:uncharacterized protein n=1 Tax=Cantharellus anzutake TaxID=1750568 RepID=UPI0019073A12